MPVVRPEGYCDVLHSIVLQGDPEPMAVTYMVETGGYSGTPNSIAAELHDALADGLGTNYNSSYALTQTEVRWQVTAPPDGPVIGLHTENRPGTGTTAMLPQNCAVLFHKRTARGGRRGRGRMYFPGVAEANVDQTGAMLPAAITSYTANLTAFLARLTTFGTSMVLAHDYPGVTQPPYDNEHFPDLVTSMTVDPRMATQRRRLR